MFKTTRKAQIQAFFQLLGRAASLNLKTKSGLQRVGFKFR